MSDHTWRNISPDIFRQRLIIEGVTPQKIDDARISDYLKELSSVCKMNALMDPFTHRSPKFGWSGWMHWETSGVHFYAWDQPNSFFSVDIYTCKQFSCEDAFAFTKKYFNTNDCVWKEVTI